MENPFRKWLSHLHVPPVLTSTAEENEPIGLLEPNESITFLAIMQSGQDRQTLHHLAMNHGWEMLCSEKWNDGVQLLKDCQCGVVLVERHFLGPDWQSGLRLLLLTSAASCVVPILAKADDHFFEEMIRCGGYDILMAPLEESTVLETVQFAWTYWKNCVALAYGY